MTGKIGTVVWPSVGIRVKIRTPNSTTGKNYNRKKKKYESKTQQAQPRQVVACAWRWGAAAPWFGGATALPMEREGAKLLEGRVEWLILLVVVSVCVVFVFCAPTNDQTTVLFFCSGRNFIQFCNNWCLYFDTTDGYLRFISTVGQTTVLPFFPVIIFSGCNLNPPKNIAGQTTVSYLFFR